MLELLINAFITLVVVIDPIGVAAIFGALTQGTTDGYRRKMAYKGTVISAIILIIFTLSGYALLAALGIGLAAFRVAGGVLLFLLAIDMVLARDSGLRSTTVREQQEAEHKADISVFPLAIPLISGPGAITSMLLLTGPSSAQPFVTVLVMAVLLVVLLITLLSLLFAGRIMKLIGVTGSGVISRVLGVLLAALAVQFIFDGLQAAFS